MNNFTINRLLVEEFFRQAAADQNRSGSVSDETLYTLLIAMLNAYHETGVFTSAYDASGCFTVTATKVSELGWPTIGAMMNTAEGEGAFDDWPMDVNPPELP